jgi:hypothetical protein
MLGFVGTNIVKSLKNRILFLMLCALAKIGHADGVHDALKDAVVCGIDPLGKIRHIVDGGSNFKSGYSTTSFGDGSANTAIVILENPIEIAGAKSSSIFGAADSNPYFDFGANVYGKFKGDFKRVVSELHLVEATDKDHVVGKYQRKLDIDSDGKPYDTCPMVIGLTPLNGGEFLLGCGWCNG